MNELKIQRKQMNARSLLNNAFENMYLILFYIKIPNMANKKKLNLASTQANKLIAGLPERREKIKAQVQFRNELSEPQKR